MDMILLEPGNPEFVFGKTSDGGKAGIELVSLHPGMKQQVTTDVSNSARNSGRPMITEFTCVKYVDQTSVKLYELCLSAQPLGSGADQPTKLYIARHSGDKAANIITIALRDALITEMQLQTHPDDMPTEQFKLSFTDIVWTYSLQQTDGQPGPGNTVVRKRPIGALTG